MAETQPVPGQTLAVLLGASIYRYAHKLAHGPAFYNSSQQFGEYLTETMGVPDENIASFFDDSRSAGDQLRDIGDFFERRTSRLKNDGTPAANLIVHYVGHGLFSGGDNDYCLAIRATDDQNEGFTSIRMRDLAAVIRNSAAFLRKFLILDCCFSGAAYKQFQSSPLSVVQVKVRDVLDDESPQRGTSLLCSASAKDPSVAPKGLPHTMFSDSLLSVLMEGHNAFGPRLSFSELGELVRLRIKETYSDMGVRPEVHSPDQRSGDVSHAPLFPNPAWTKAAAEQAATEKKWREQEESERVEAEQRRLAAEVEEKARQEAEAERRARQAALDAERAEEAAAREAEAQKARESAARAAAEAQEMQRKALAEAARIEAELQWQREAAAREAEAETKYDAADQNGRTRREIELLRTEGQFDSRAAVDAKNSGDLSNSSEGAVARFISSLRLIRLPWRIGELAIVATLIVLIALYFREKPASGIGATSPVLSPSSNSSALGSTEQRATQESPTLQNVSGVQNQPNPSRQVPLGAVVKERPPLGPSTNPPKPKAVAPQRISVSGGVAVQMQVKRTEPVYPPIARAAHITGTVVLNVVISKDGKVEELNVVSGPQMLWEAAIDAVKQWRYRPYLVDDQPVEIVTQVDVIFTLTH